MSIGQPKTKKAALLLTVNERAELVGPNGASYQELLNRLIRVETLAAIRRGMTQAERGEGIPVEEAAQRLRKKHGFSR
jgi:glycerol-3-phosphate O-acyltransferase